MSRYGPLPESKDNNDISLKLGYYSTPVATRGSAVVSVNARWDQLGTIHLDDSTKWWLIADVNYFRAFDPFHRSDTTILLPTPEGAGVDVT